MAVRLISVALVAGLFLISSSVVMADDSIDSSTVWMINPASTELWSSPDDSAVSFGHVPPGTYFEVVGQQEGERVYVLDTRTNNYAYVTLSDLVHANDPADAESDSQSATRRSQGWWVINHRETPLWSGPEESAITLGVAGAWNFFQVLEPQSGERLRVRDRFTDGEAYIDAVDVGPAGPPETDDHPAQWWGYVGVGEANARSEPNTEGEPLGRLPRGTPVLVQEWVEGERVASDDPTWARLSDGTYVWAPLLRRAATEGPPDPPRVLAADRWIDVNLTFQTVAAYERDELVYWALTSSGRPGWQTPVGLFTVGRRVENETMDSSTLLGRDAQRADYRVENVRWTQYFTPFGHALHENYWKLPESFGIPSSHGCLGLLAEDAEWFWTWAQLGTPILIHH